MNKDYITKQIKNISKEDAITDLEKFFNLENLSTTTTSNVGNKFLDYFFLKYRLDTKGRKGISFFEFMKDNKIKQKPSNIKLYNYGIKTKKEYVAWYDVFRVYYGSIAQFKPVIAYSVYSMVKPTSILDFSAGWGGRLLGAVKYDCKYTGFDTNRDLEKPYREIIKVLGAKKCKVVFQDSSKVDFSKYTYDTVFTSPPYYKTELYNGMPDYSSYDDWHEKFFKPVISNSYKHLQKGGSFCLNVPRDIYEDTKKILGRKANKKVRLGLTSRNGGIKYKEYIYIWNK
jgi:hypothetical protein